MKQYLTDKSKLLLLCTVGIFLITPIGAKADPATPDPNTSRDYADSFFADDTQSGMRSPHSFKQSDRNQDNDALRRMEESARIGRAAGPGNNFNDLRDMAFSNFDSAGIARFGGLNSWCKDGEAGSEECISADPSLTLPHSTGEKISSFNFLSPVSGVTDTLNSKVYVNQITQNMASPLAVLTSTMNLTEPGLTRGMMDSMQMAGNATSLRMQADQAVFARAQALRGAGDMFAAGYDAQVARYRAEGRSWIEAQSLALGGERTAPNGTLFENADAAAIMNFKADPNHPQAPENQAGELQNNYNDNTPYKENVIRALDYVFNSELSRPTVANSDQHKATLKALRKSFEDLIGDIQFTIGKPNNGSLVPPAPNTTGSTDGVLAISMKRLPPRAKPEVFFRNLVVNRYRDLHNILYLRCRFEKNGSSIGVPYGNAGGDTNDAVPEMPKVGSDGKFLEPNSKGTNFWADSGGAHQLMVRISTTGFRPQPKVLESLYTMFLNDERPFSFSATGEIQVDCDRLLTGPGDASNLFDLISEAAVRPGGGRKIAVNVTERVRASFTIAEHVAFGQYLGTLAKAEDFIRSSTGGAYDSMVRQSMLDMIYSVAGTQKIREAIDKNNDELKVIGMQLMDSYRAASADGAGGLIEAFGAGGAMNTGGQ